MKSTTIAVDVAKEVLEVAVSVRPGQVSEQHRLSRTAFMKFCTDQPPATFLLEACGSAHYWGRRLETLGHHVVLLPPHATRPYVFRNKTDRTDTAGCWKPSATLAGEFPKPPAAKDDSVTPKEPPIKSCNNAPQGRRTTPAILSSQSSPSLHKNDRVRRGWYKHLA